MHLLKAPRLRLWLAARAVTLGLAGGTVALAQPALADQIGQAPTAANITGNGSFATRSDPDHRGDGLRRRRGLLPDHRRHLPGDRHLPRLHGHLVEPVLARTTGVVLGFVVVGIETNTLFDRLLNTRLERRCKRRRSNPFHAVPQWRVKVRTRSPADYARRP